MAKKQRRDEQVHVNFMMPRRLHDDLREAASSLCLDLSSLLRLMLAEHVREYMDRGERATRGSAKRSKRKTPLPPQQERLLDW